MVTYRNTCGRNARVPRYPLLSRSSRYIGLKSTAHRIPAKLEFASSFPRSCLLSLHPRPFASTMLRWPVRFRPIASSLPDAINASRNYTAKEIIIAPAALSRYALSACARFNRLVSWRNLWQSAKQLFSVDLWL